MSKRKFKNDKNITIEVIEEEEETCEEGSAKKKPKSAKDLFAVFKPDEHSESEEETEDHVTANNEYEENVDKKDVKMENDKDCASESESEGEDSKKNDEEDSKKKKQKKYYKRYTTEWEKVPAFKSWISASILGETYFYCKLCKKDYRSGKSELYKHMSAKKHKQNAMKSECPVQKQFLFKGLLCPVVTPFENTRNCEVNYSVLASYASFLKACGVKGILVNDITGEGMSLTMAERKKLLEKWVDLSREHNFFIMVQIGGVPVKCVTELVFHAEKLKVNAIVLMPDLYHRPKNHLDIIRYIKIISGYCKNMPIFYHHHPKHYGINDIDMTQFMLDITGEIDNFVGLIYTTNDLQAGLSALRINEEKFTVFLGTDEVILGAVASGFSCIMSNSLNILPKLIQSIYQSAKNGELQLAQKSQHLLNKALDCIYSYGNNVAGLKTGMKIITSLPILTVREPMDIIWEGNRDKIKKKLQEVGVV